MGVDAIPSEEVLADLQTRLQVMSSFKNMPLTRRQRKEQSCNRATYEALDEIARKKWIENFHFEKCWEQKRVKGPRKKRKQLRTQHMRAYWIAEKQAAKYGMAFMHGCVQAGGEKLWEMLTFMQSRFFELGVGDIFSLTYKLGNLRKGNGGYSVLRLSPLEK